MTANRDAAGAPPATVAVVLAAGQGTRMGAAGNKVWLPLAGMPILARSLAVFERVAAVDETLLVASASELAQCRALVERYALGKVRAIIAGGATRHASERCALDALRARITGGAVGMVLIHDAARPLVRPAEVARLVADARRVGGALLAAPALADESFLLAREDGAVAEWLAPEWLARAQTPQAFAARPLLAAYDAAGEFEGTDTAATYARAGHPVVATPGSADNLKITTPGDLARAERVLRARRR
ncbi:MAG TPA: IspD/TarI family cytidylyltransferase [Ktedonobacterales bacterium]|jgi:2-C-methyl-D-erythritol 4-phosphate cytidylyltransferase